jgi:hypothetical protein
MVVAGAHRILFSMILESSSSSGRSSSSLPVFFFSFGFRQLNCNPWAVQKSTVPTGTYMERKKSLTDN